MKNNRSMLKSASAEPSDGITLDRLVSRAPDPSLPQLDPPKEPIGFSLRRL